MNCAFSKEVLALYVEGDLTDESANTVRHHLSRCSECEDFCDGLQNTQGLLKSLRRTVATPDALTEVRHRVFARIENVRDALGLAVRLERFFLLGIRRRKYAMAAALVFAIVSASVLGEMQQRVDLRDSPVNPPAGAHLAPVEDELALDRSQDIVVSHFCLNRNY